MLMKIFTELLGEYFHYRQTPDKVDPITICE